MLKNRPNVSATQLGKLFSPNTHDCQHTWDLVLAQRSDWRGRAIFPFNGPASATGSLFMLNEARFDIQRGLELVPNLSAMVKSDVIDSKSLVGARTRVGLMMQLCSGEIAASDFVAAWNWSLRSE